MKRQKQLTKRERKELYGKGPSSAPGRSAPLTTALRQVLPPQRQALNPEDFTPRGARESLVTDPKAREWIIDVLGMFASALVRRVGDDRPNPTLVVWLTPDEAAQFNRLQRAKPEWFYDDVVSALRSVLGAEEVDARVRGHSLGVIEMEMPMPRWQQLEAPLLNV